MPIIQILEKSVTESVIEINYQGVRPELTRRITSTRKCRICSPNMHLRVKLTGVPEITRKCTWVFPNVFVSCLQITRVCFGNT